MYAENDDFRRLRDEALAEIKSEVEADEVQKRRRKSLDEIEDEIEKSKAKGAKGRVARETLAGEWYQRRPRFVGAVSSAEKF